MVSIRDLPPERILNIFELGCNENPSSRMHGTFNLSSFRRFKHPFMAPVSATCRLWKLLSKQEHNNLLYFTHIYLALDVHQSDQCHRFIIDLSAYRKALLLSNGSNLFIEWILCDIQSGRDSELVLLGLLIHAMDMIIPYQDQLRGIIVDISPPAAISHLMSVRCDLNSTSSHKWTLQCHLQSLQAVLDNG